MYSGDVLEGGQLHAAFPYRAYLKDGGFARLLRAQYPHLVSAFSVDSAIEPEQAGALVERLRTHIESELRFYRRSELSARLCFCVRVLDAPGPNHYVVRIAHRAAEVGRAMHVPTDSIAAIEVCHTPLLHSMSEEWGGVTTSCTATAAV